MSIRDRDHGLLEFYKQINIEIKIIGPENPLLDMFHHFRYQFQNETLALAAILNFNGHMAI